jgi:uncharacterized protein (TIGR02611 family)
VARADHTTGPDRPTGALLTAQHRDDDEAPGLLDDVADRLGFRDRIKAHPALGPIYRIAVAVVGVAVVALGIFLLPFPGPGWLVIFLGLGILATEFAWAERLLNYARGKVHQWTDWIRHQKLAIRLLLGASTVVLVAAFVGGYVAWQGVPFVSD